jgi:hypothetical protein
MHKRQSKKWQKILQNSETFESMQLIDGSTGHICWQYFF